MLDFKNKIRNNSPAKSSLLVSYSNDEIAAMAEHLAGKTIHAAQINLEVQWSCRNLWKILPPEYNFSLNKENFDKFLQNSKGAKITVL